MTNKIVVSWEGFLFGLTFLGLGITLMIITFRDFKSITPKAFAYLDLALPAIVISTGLTLMVLSFV